MFGWTFSTLTLILCLIGGQDTQTVLNQSPGAVTVTEGGTVTFRCDLRSSNVDYTVDRYIVHWHHSRDGPVKLSHYVGGRVYRSRGFSERFQLSRNVSSNSFILTITELQLRDTNTYICQIWGNVFGKGTRLNVTSANVPVLLQSPSLERVTKGHTARLQCTMRNARVTHTDVHWYWEQPGNTMQWGLTHDTRNIIRWSSGFPERFLSSRDSSNETFILTITNVQPNDTGVYYCKVWGDISGNGSQLTVTDPLADPVLIQDPVVSKVAEGETAEFQCAMHNASVIDTDVHWHYQRPDSNREWVISHFVNGTLTTAQGFHDRVLLSRNVSRNSYTLSLVNVTLNDTAVYSCSVWSYIYGAGSHLNVTVANPPVLLQSLIVERVTEGHTAQLQCTMRNAAVTHTDVHWHRKQPGSNTEWVLTLHVGNNTRWSPGFTQRFQSSRDPSNNSFILTITNVQPNDTGVYYCKVWGDIIGNGTQLTVTEQSGNWLLMTIIGTTLAFVLLLCILLIVLLYMKKWACFQSRSKPEGTSEEELNTVYATVSEKVQKNEQAPTPLAEGEMYYADIQFFRKKTGGQVMVMTEESTEYATIKHT
ncbi:tyrosine-protein phosphatase non-receptor type substrate 1-like isoform X2 [Hemiscyllium ocellatum]|uniref:tyrosine-protein phosphatase non-receptor type substrate 1-like isoform X2 n=1 Tax=Hemiscyllium ocellatum TaxID=170820 RepID=UPI0029667F97|nr:tyrosine-protein phosphatase non-receptor type substrate 1-like isoform X2 [Hemiscyllium ocellatum]